MEISNDVWATAHYYLLCQRPPLPQLPPPRFPPPLPARHPQRQAHPPPADMHM